MKSSALLALIVFSLPITAQQAPAPAGKLAFLVQDLVRISLAGVNPPEVRTAIDQAVQPRFASINTGVASALSNLPVPSPASAIGYLYNYQAGADVPYPKSLGPILSERAETIGRNKFYFALTFQRFQFDQLDEVDFRSLKLGVPVSLPVLGTTIPGLLTSDSTVGLSISQTTAHFSYGLTRNIDVTASLPIVASSMTVAAEGGFRSPIIPVTSAFPRAGVAASATGLGDALVRVKGRFLGRKSAGLALVTDFRIPTGDEFNYHGAGAYGVKPFLAASVSKGRVSPHINAGYQFNGRSFLATPLAREKARLPGEFFYAVGTELALSKQPTSPRQVTLTADLLDRVVINGPRTVLNTRTAFDGSTYQSFDFVNRTRHEMSASIGFKAELRSGIVVSFNLLFRLNNAGLRARAVPFAGASYIY